MDFDFHRQYEHYSIPQLLEIVEHAASYQAAAVTAATEILAQKDARLVAEARQQLYPLPQRLEEATGQSIFDEGLPIYDPRHVAAVSALLIGLQLALAGKIVWRMLPFLGSLPTFETQFAFAMLIIPVMTVLLHFATAALLWRKVALGWYLAMILVLYNLATRISLILFLVFSDGGYDAEGMIMTNGLDLALNGSVAFLLWIPLTRDMFGIPGRNRNWTAGVTLAIAFIMNAYRYYSVFG